MPCSGCQLSRRFRPSSRTSKKTSPCDGNACTTVMAQYCGGSPVRESVESTFGTGTRRNVRDLRKDLGENALDHRHGTRLVVRCHVCSPRPVSTGEDHER